VTQIAIAKEGLVQVHNDENNPPNQSSAGNGKVEDLEPWQMPCIMLETHMPADIKRRKGFWDSKHLLCDAAVVHGGNLDELVKTVTKMT
jgi:hypothetical protein